MCHWITVCFFESNIFPFPFELWKLDEADKCLWVTRIYWCDIAGFAFDLVTACTVNKRFSFLLCLLSLFWRTRIERFSTVGSIPVVEENFLEKGQFQVRCFFLLGIRSRALRNHHKNHKNIIRAQLHTTDSPCLCLQQQTYSTRSLSHFTFNSRLCCVNLQTFQLFSFQWCGLFSCGVLNEFFFPANVSELKPPDRTQKSVPSSVTGRPGVMCHFPETVM